MAASNHSMTATDYAYLAGVLDGEGYVALVKPGRAGGRSRPQIEVSSTDPELINWLSYAVGGWTPTPRQERPNRKIEYRWRCTGKEAASLANHVAPYMQIVRKKTTMESFIGW